MYIKDIKNHPPALKNVNKKILSILPCIFLK